MSECDQARRDLYKANKMYRTFRTLGLFTSLLDKQRNYRKVKCKATCIYNNKQRDELYIASKSNPKKLWDLLKKYKNKPKFNSNISMTDFYHHFKNLFSNTDNFLDENVERSAEDLFNQNILVDSLDGEFTVDEVCKAISCLKQNKSAGDDSLIPEVFLDANNFLAPYLC